MARRLLGIVCVGACAVAGTALAGAPRAYSDPRGDTSGGPGPDLVAITVTSTATSVRFTVRFASAPPLRQSAEGGWIDMLLLGIDVPPLGPAPTPAGWRGVDYAVGLHGAQTQVVVRRLPGSSVVRLPLVRRGATLIFAIPLARLGRPTWFAFTAAAAREGAQEGQGGVDVAPASGVFRYRLAG